MKTNKRKIGISLIVLIITIIVVIILAAVVILTLSKNNPIESAKEARFKEDVRTFQDELALYISKQYANAGGHWDGSITAKTYDEIVEYIPSFTKKYEGKFVINNNNLEYTNKLDDKEKEYAQSLNAKKYSILPDEYQQVEYLESTGTQWIDTEIIPNIDTKMSINLACLGSLSKVNWSGCVLNSNGGWFAVGSYGTSEQLVSLFCVNARAGVKGYPFDNDFHEYYISNGLQKIDSTISNNTITNFNNNMLNICLFKGKNNYSGDVAGLQKIKYCSLWNGDILIRNFIPCYSTANVTNADGDECDTGTVGLYDTVEGKFYTNQGDKTKGDFIPGPKVK